MIFVVLKLLFLLVFIDRNIDLLNDISGTILTTRGSNGISQQGNLSQYLE